MKNIYAVNQYFKLSFMVFFSVMLTSFLGSAKATETISDSFKNNTSSILTFGGSPNKAFLTANSDSLIDTEGDGWLRLTRDQKEQKGFVIVNQSFSSEGGVLIDFEFAIWRTNSDGFGGADGFSIFLYDATVTPFSMGGFGGSLGYAQRQIDSNSPLEHGLTGGYIGIGFDVYGNYSRINEARDGGISFSPTKNTIGIRGPGSQADNWLKGYSWLTGNSNLGFELQAGQVNGRPDGTSYYRRTQIEISPQPSGKYSITVSMMTQKNGTFSKVLGPYDLPTIPPALLKMGLAASTGASINIHEIRNLSITYTPSNTAIKSITCDNFTILANSINNILNVTYPSTLTGAAKAEIVDQTGTIMKRIELNMTHSEIDISGLTKGLYIVRINNSRQWWTSKFIKQ